MSSAQSLSSCALRGALAGLVLAVWIAAPLWLFSEPPSGIEKDAFADYLDR